MTLTQVKTAAAAYLQTTTADFTSGGVDLWLLAANQTRLLAELNNDFEFSRARFSLSVSTSSDASLGDATLVSGGSAGASIKTVIDVAQLDDLNNLRPVEWTTTAESFQRVRSDNPGYSMRYPTDGQAVTEPSGRARVLFHNDVVSLFPKVSTAQTFTIYLDTYTFMAEWVDANLGTSFAPWTTVGHQFLLWGTIVHLNHLKKEFVPRTEGNLSPPIALRDEGLEVLKQWDSFKFEQYRRHQR